MNLQACRTVQGHCRRSLWNSKTLYNKNRSFTYNMSIFHWILELSERWCGEFNFPPKTKQTLLMAKFYSNTGSNGASKHVMKPFLNTNVKTDSLQITILSMIYEE